MELLLGQRERESEPQQLQTSIDNLAEEVKQVAHAKYKSELQNCVCNFFQNYVCYFFLSRCSSPQQS